MTEVTLTLPDEIWRRAEGLARRVGRPVSDVLAETIELSLRPLADAGKPDVDFSALSDEQVLAAARTEMDLADDERLSLLLQRQQAGTLAAAEQADLAGLLCRYQQSLVHKAQALREAVRRGLMEPLKP